MESKTELLRHWSGKTSDEINWEKKREKSQVKIIGNKVDS